MTGETVVRIDCHVHTRGSYDSTATLDGVLESAADSGLDGVVVTDHDCLSYALAAVDRADAFGLVAIPGVEVSTADGHLLGIGIETRPPSGLSFDGTVERIRDAGGVTVVPHPFQRSRHGVSAEAIGDCDGIEVFNAHTMTGFRNRQATRFAARRGYSCFAGSDAHRAGVVGCAYTEVAIETRPPTREGILAAMRAGRVRATGSRIPAKQYVRRLVRNAKRGSAQLLKADYTGRRNF